MVGEHEHWMMERWVLAPPTHPMLVAPWPTQRAEHVTSHDRCANADISLGSERIIHAFVTLLSAECPAESRVTNNQLCNTCPPTPIGWSRL